MLEFFDRPDHRLIEKGFGSCVERPLGLVDMRSKRILKNVSSGGFLFLKEIPRSKDKSLEFIGLRWGSIPKRYPLDLFRFPNANEESELLKIGV